MDGRSSVFEPAHLVCHCLLVETNDALVLVDTGFGTRDVAVPQQRLSRFFRAQLRPNLRRDMTALAQVEALGYRPSDVRHIVLTHLDFDHAGGLDDFPQAAVHLLAAERDAAMKQGSWLDRRRFRPAQWHTSGQWHAYAAGEGHTWFGFSCVRDLDGLPPEILLVPLIGHTHGHAGVAVHGRDGWLLHAGDAYFYHAEMDVLRPRCTPGLRAYQWMMEKNRPARLWNQRRLRELKARHGVDVDIFCAHDLRELETFLDEDAFGDEPRWRAPRVERAPHLHA